jgi:hypothetical protein
MKLLMCLIVAMSGFTQTFKAGVAIRSIRAGVAKRIALYGKAP